MKREIKIQQFVKGKLEYEDMISNYDYHVNQFFENGATKITIEYPSSTIIVTKSAPNKEDSQ